MARDRFEMGECVTFVPPGGLRRGSRGGAAMMRVAVRRIDRVVATAAFFAALVTGASGQDWTAPRTSDQTARAWERVEDRSAGSWEAQAKKAAQIQKAREEEWDRKTKRATRSICTGVKGC